MLRCRYSAVTPGDIPTTGKVERKQSASIQICEIQFTQQLSSFLNNLPSVVVAVYISSGLLCIFDSAITIWVQQCWLRHAVCAGTPGRAEVSGAPTTIQDLTWILVNYAFLTLDALYKSQSPWAAHMIYTLARLSLRVGSLTNRFSG